MKKRGLSTVIVYLIIILLVLVSIGIMWIVIRDLVEDTSKEISFNSLTGLEIKKVLINPDENSINVTVKRNPGINQLTGIKYFKFNKFFNPSREH